MNIFLTVLYNWNLRELRGIISYNTRLYYTTVRVHLNWRCYLHPPPPSRRDLHQQCHRCRQKCQGDQIFQCSHQQHPLPHLGAPFQHHFCCQHQAAVATCRTSYPVLRQFGNQATSRWAGWQSPSRSWPGPTERMSDCERVCPPCDYVRPRLPRLGSCVMPIADPWWSRNTNRHTMSTILTA